VKLLRYKVISYLGCTPQPLRQNHKTNLLRQFITGVIRSGDLGKVQIQRVHNDCHVAMIQGFVHENSDRVPHLNFRRDILQKQKENNNHTLIADSNLFNYIVGTEHPAYFHRYSFDGVFPTTGNYFDEGHDPNRWTKISKELDVKLQPWRNDGAHVLVCCQRNGGWSMKGYPTTDWIISVVKQIRQYTDRLIVIRPHPGDKKALGYLKQIKHDIGTKHKISTAKNIREDLKNAWVTVTYNSSPGVASAIEGVPVFVTDPVPQTSQAFAIANTDLSKIEYPLLPERQEWIEKIAMCHWSVNELTDGSAWQHLRKFV